MQPIKSRMPPVGDGRRRRERSLSGHCGSRIVVTAHLGRIVPIVQERTSGDSVVRPLQADRSLTPGTKEGNPASFEGSEGIAGLGGDRTLADDHEPGFGPPVEPFRVGGLAAVVWGQENIGRRLGRRTLDQLVQTQLLEIARQEQMAPVEGDVEHETACVVGGFRVPAVRRMRNCELDASLVPRPGCRDRVHRDASRPQLFDQPRRHGIVHAGETRREPHFPDREPVEQVWQAVVVVLIGVAQEDRVDAADAARPERRRDDAAADGRIAQAAAIVEESLTVGRVDQDRQAVPDGQEFGLQRGVSRAQRRRATSRARSRLPGATRRLCG